MRMSTACLAAVTLCFALIATTVPAKKTTDSTPSVGASVILEITGDLAKQYHALQTPDSDTPPGIHISTSAQIAQKLKNGQYRLEHSLTMNSKAGAPRMITLTAVVNADAFTHHVVPENTEVFASPSDQNPVKTTKQTTASSVSLSDLKNVKLRSWILDHEVGQ